jgi:hypothetical protein
MESMKQKRFDLTYRRLQRGGVGAVVLGTMRCAGDLTASNRAEVRPVCDF